MNNLTKSSEILAYCGSMICTILLFVLIMFLMIIVIDIIVNFVKNIIDNNKNRVNSRYTSIKYTAFAVEENLKNNYHKAGEFMADSISYHMIRRYYEYALYKKYNYLDENNKPMYFHNNLKTVIIHKLADELFLQDRKKEDGIHKVKIPTTHEKGLSVISIDYGCYRYANNQCDSFSPTEEFNALNIIYEELSKFSRNIWFITRNTYDFDYKDEDARDKSVDIYIKDFDKKKFAAYLEDTLIKYHHIPEVINYLEDVNENKIEKNIFNKIFNDKNRSNVYA